MFARPRRRALPERRAVIRGTALALGPANLATFFKNDGALIFEEAEN